MDNSSPHEGPPEDVEETYWEQGGDPEEAVDDRALVRGPTGADTLTAMRARVAALAAEQDEERSALGVVSATVNGMVDAAGRHVLGGTELPRADVDSARGCAGEHRTTGGSQLTRDDVADDVVTDSTEHQAVAGIDRHRGESNAERQTPGSNQLGDEGVARNVVNERQAVDGINRSRAEPARADGRNAEHL